MMSGTRSIPICEVAAENPTVKAITVTGCCGRKASAWCVSANPFGPRFYACSEHIPKKDYAVTDLVTGSVRFG